MASELVSPIRTSSLEKVYPPSGKGSREVRAVDGVDLEVAPGEFFGLLGPNGAGKSTTIGMLTTRVLPTSGRAEIAGIDVVKDPVRAKLLIGVVPQTNTLDRQLNVVENLEFHGRYFGMSRRDSRKRAEDLLEQFQLADRANANVFTLSGGMAQRLMIARALVHRPQVLFLDEPTSGIDPQTRLVLWDLLRDLHSQGQTILLTTHYMEEADVLCERVAIIDHGKILVDGSPDELKASLGAASVLTLKAAGRRLGAWRKAVAALPAVSRTEVDADSTKIYAANSKGLLAKVVTMASDHDLQVTDATSQQPTLEAVFLAKTGRDLRD